MLDKNVALIKPTKQCPLLKNYEIPFANLKISDEIGRGEYGVVHKATAIQLCKEEAETEVAVKLSYKDPTSLNAMSDELSIMANLQKDSKQAHPNIVKLLGSITTRLESDLEIYAITEFCHHGSIKSFIGKNRQYFNNQLGAQQVSNITTNVYSIELR